MNEFRIIMVTVKEAVKILREHGWKGDEGHLRAGIDAGVYDFGVSSESGHTSNHNTHSLKITIYI